MISPSRILIFLCLLCISGNFASAQNPFKKHADVFSSSLKVKPKLFGGLDSRHSFISKREVNIIGLRLGLNYNDRVRFSFGLYFLETPFYRSQILSSGDTITSKLGFAYMAMACEYVLFKTRRWEISVPFYAGLGTTSLIGLDSLTRGPILPLETSVNALYKIFPWIGIGWGVGYRYMFINNRKVPENFNNPIYIISVKLYFGVLYRVIFKKKKSDLMFPSL